MTNTERLEQITLVNELRKKYPLTHSIPNGGKRDISTAKKLKQEGLLPGVPDLFVPELGLYIELKRTKGGMVSAEQKAFIAGLEGSPCWCIVAMGALDALEQLERR